MLGAARRGSRARRVGDSVLATGPGRPARREQQVPMPRRARGPRRAARGTAGVRAPVPPIAYRYYSHHARLRPFSSAYRRHSGYNATTTAIHTR